MKIFCKQAIFLSILATPLAHGEYMYKEVLKEERIYEQDFIRTQVERINVRVGEDLEGEDRKYQAAAMLGRDDMIPPGRSVGTQCAPFNHETGGILEYIQENARQTSVVIINEAHDMPVHRQFIQDVLEALSEQGYFLYAAETFSNSNLGEDAADVRLYGEEPFIRSDSGYYTNEPVFGRTVRTAKRLGYELIPYEIYGGQLPSQNTSIREMTSARQIFQAENLMENVFEHYSEPKLVVHVGYNHGAEVPSESGSIMMGYHLARMSGVNPFTINQTHCIGTSETRLTLPSSTASGMFDIAVSHPEAEYIQGRPAWRRAKGERDVQILHELRPDDKPVVIEAHYFDEPYEAVPVDRLFIRPGENLPLILAPGHYKVSAIYTDKVNSKVYELTVH